VKSGQLRHLAHTLSAKDAEKGGAPYGSRSLDFVSDSLCEAATALGVTASSRKSLLLISGATGMNRSGMRPGPTRGDHFRFHGEAC
jgi:hypothetical protein